jgi:hypothetical protein
VSAETVAELDAMLPHTIPFHRLHPPTRHYRFRHNQRKGGSTALYEALVRSILNLHPGAIEPNSRVGCVVIQNFDFGPGELIGRQWVPIGEVG